MLMQLNITARHLDLTPALSDYVHRKVEKAQRYFDSIIWAQTILSIEKHRHIAEIIIHTPGSTFRTKGEAGDLYSAVDLATQKLDLHLTRVKDKKRNHRDSKTKIRFQPILTDNPEPPADFGGVSEVAKVILEPRSLTSALRHLRAQPKPFLMFINERTNQVSAVYKKGKEGFGLVETVMP